MEQKIELLRNRLEGMLPGDDAHERMTVIGRREATAKADKSKARKSAVLIMLYPHQGDLHFPIIQRPDYGGVHSRQMAFPGGSHDPEDADLIETALRECREEIGVDIPRSQVVGQLSELYIPPSNFLVTPVIAYASRPSSYKPSEKEVEQIYEVPLSLLPKVAGKMRVEIRPGVWMEVPGYEVFGQIVWGATAMILSELLHIWEEI